MPPPELALLRTWKKQKTFIASSSVMIGINPTHFLNLSPICTLVSHACILILVLSKITRVSLPTYLYILYQSSCLSLLTKSTSVTLICLRCIGAFLLGQSTCTTSNQWIYMGRVEQDTSEPFLQQSYSCS